MNPLVDGGPTTPRIAADLLAVVGKRRCRQRLYSHSALAVYFDVKWRRCGRRVYNMTIESVTKYGSVDANTVEREIAHAQEGKAEELLCQDKTTFVLPAHNAFDLFETTTSDNVSYRVLRATAAAKAPTGGLPQAARFMRSTMMNFLRWQSCVCASRKAAGKLLLRKYYLRVWLLSILAQQSFCAERAHGSVHRVGRGVVWHGLIRPSSGHLRWAHNDTWCKPVSYPCQNVSCTWSSPKLQWSASPSRMINARV